MVEGLTGAWGLKNESMAWSSLFDPAPPALFAHLRDAFLHAFDARWATRFLCPAVPTCTTLLQSGHSNVLEYVNVSLVLLCEELESPA